LYPLRKSIMRDVRYGITRVRQRISFKYYALHSKVHYWIAARGLIKDDLPF
jgi:hypothetical protein